MSLNKDLDILVQLFTENVTKTQQLFYTESINIVLLTFFTCMCTFFFSNAFDNVLKLYLIKIKCLKN